MEIKFAPGFKKSMDKMFSWRWAPYRAIRWILRIPREIKWFFQRATRGYADSDVWNLDDYILSWLPKALKQLAKDTGGYPLEFKNIEEWEKVLEKISNLLEKGKEKMDSTDEEDIKLLNKEFEEGMDLLKKHFFSLWD